MDTELILRWQDEPFAMRYRMMNRSEGGFGIRSSVPVLTGTVGTVLRILPKGERLSQPVMVAWIQEHETGDLEIGLRCLEA